VKLTANQKRALRRLWEENLTLDEIASDLTFSTYEWPEEAVVTEFDVPAVLRAAMFLCLGPRPDVPPPPSQEEIRIAAAKIRAGWTQAERESRLRSAWGGTIDNATGDNNGADGSATDYRAEGDAPAPQARRQRDRRRAVEGSEAADQSDGGEAGRAGLF
jgi:hypothetical protein